MKGFTLWEPWASLMAHGCKGNETRGWPTKYRGPLAIHAAKTQKGLGSTIMRDIFKVLPEEETYKFMAEPWPFGKVVAVVDLVECITTEEAVERGLSELEKTCGDYGPGRFAWITKNLRRIKPAIPWKGMQGLWNVPAELLERLKA